MVGSPGGYDDHPGQRQMPARWDGMYGVDRSQRDRYTSHCGGQGFCTDGTGSQAAVDAGSSIAPLQQAGVPARARAHAGPGRVPPSHSME
ncbi:hypothetical protein ACWDRR_39070 [Kitasatospora sp. NPDC003701]